MILGIIEIQLMERLEGRHTCGVDFPESNLSRYKAKILWCSVAPSTYVNDPFLLKDMGKICRVDSGWWSDPIQVLVPIAVQHGSLDATSLWPHGRSLRRVSSLHLLRPWNHRTALEWNSPSHWSRPHGMELLLSFRGSATSGLIFSWNSAPVKNENQSFPMLSAPPKALRRFDLESRNLPSKRRVFIKILELTWQWLKTCSQKKQGYEWCWFITMFSWRIFFFYSKPWSRPVLTISL